MNAGAVITMGSVLLLFVTFTSLLVYIKYCFSSSDQVTEASPSGRRRRGGAVVGNNNTRGRGVDPELLRSLPVTVYRSAAAKGSPDDAVECTVCLAGLEDGDDARFLPRCGHGFHAECVDMWLSSHTTCPLCRLTVAKPDMAPGATVLALALRPVAAEPANFGASMPANLLLGVSDHQGAVNAPASSP